MKIAPALCAGNTLVLKAAEDAPLAVLENPAKRRLIATIPRGDAADVEGAVEAAARAFPAWSDSLSGMTLTVGGARFSSNGLLLLVCPGAGGGDPIDLRPGLRIFPQEPAKVGGASTSTRQ